MHESRGLTGATIRGLVMLPPFRHRRNSTELSSRFSLWGLPIAWMQATRNPATANVNAVSSSPGRSMRAVTAPSSSAALWFDVRHTPVPGGPALADLCTGTRCS
jgi:hypothetical protein